ncbi:MAG: DUF2971 domain-containing protein [Candidatus Marinimicrobia bacterium]|nr:DUF2971 domain-containing protein [Candidatus Neomarinimicrobiota bacterium]
MDSFQKIISVILTIEDKPPSLYHYSTQAGLMGILESKKIWATNIRYFNDSMEFKYASQLIHRRFKQIFSSNDNNENMFYNWIDRSHILKEYEVYVSSFSIVNDLLSQWRAYCPKNDGYSIGFKFDELTKSANQLSKAVLLPCVYKKKYIKDIIGDLKQFVLSEFINILKLKNYKSQVENKLEALSNTYTKMFLLVASVLKDDSFLEEKEWRLIYFKSKKEDSTQINFRAGTSTIIPYVELQLQTKFGLFPLSEIIIGPNQYKQLAKESLKIYLNSLNLKCKTAFSSVPYRVI